jgi:hypothetical protein
MRVQTRRPGLRERIICAILGRHASERMDPPRCDRCYRRLFVIG